MYNLNMLTKLRQLYKNTSKGLEMVVSTYEGNSNTFYIGSQVKQGDFILGTPQPYITRNNGSK